MSTDNLKSEETLKVEAILKRLMNAARVNDEDGLAKVLGVSHKTIAGWRFRGSVPYEHCERVAREKRTSLDWIITGRQITFEDFGLKPPSDDEGNIFRKELGVGAKRESSLSDFVMVPRYEVHASAGHGAVIHSEQIVDYLAFRADWIHTALGVTQKDLALIEVHGDSMEPTLSNGDLILLDMRHGKVMDNSVYAIQLNGGLLVKRIQRKLNGSIIVKSDNPRYEPESLDPTEADQLRVVGRVVWAGRRM